MAMFRFGDPSDLPDSETSFLPLEVAVKYIVAIREAESRGDRTEAWQIADEMRDYSITRASQRLDRLRRLDQERVQRRNKRNEG
ncbi:hypothetical protein [Agromyces sp. Marseille-Q5079]|uniref:hypothetical protein n=1 Tax=Agromyces sp. Marseille-Q5079 TaxID=3439059 RepID=UPI003D9C98A6